MVFSILSFGALEVLLPVLLVFEFFEGAAGLLPE